jgi:spermidine synthase
MKSARIIPLFSLFLTGFNALAGQVILIRELLIAFAGNELTIGIFFANLLLLEALGSFIASHRVERSTVVTFKFVCLQILLSFSLPVIIFCTRIIRTTLGILPGETINLLLLFTLSLVLLLPFGLLNGVLFSYACRLLTEWQEKNYLIAGKVYLLESAGSIAGGLIVTYLALKYLTSFQTANLIIFFTLLSGFMLFNQSVGLENKSGISLYRSSRIAVVALLIVFTLLPFSPLNDYLQTLSCQQQWRSYQVLSYNNSIYGNVTLLKQMDQYILLANGIPTATFPVPDIEASEDFIHLPFLFHTSAQRILLIGGGPGGVIREILKHPVQKIDYAELDPLLLQTVQKYIPVSDQQELDDPRLWIHLVDGRFFLQQYSGKYDIIFLNLPDPANLEINRFYTIEFFNICFSKLNSNGLLVFQLPGSATYLNRELVYLNGCLLKTVQKIFRSVFVVPDESNLFVAAVDRTLPSSNTEQLIERFKQQKIATRMITPVYLKYKLSAWRRSDFMSLMDSLRDVRLNTDLSPVALYYSLTFHSSAHSPGFAAWMHRVQKINLYQLGPAILLIIILLLWKPYRRRRSGNRNIFILTPIITSGFIGMGIPIVFVLLFQSLFGYIYFWIGLLLTSFMTGLAAGSLWINHRLGTMRHELKGFLVLLVLLTFYLLLLILILNGIQFTPGYIHSTATMKFFFLLSTAVCGFLVGAQFPLANKIYLGHETSISRTGGQVYGADLIGAWLGGMVVTVLLIPVHGIINTLLVFLLLNLFSLCFIILAARK